MKLRAVFEGISYQSTVNPELEVAGITCDSRQVERGSIFVCVKGGRFDGHDHAYQAMESGAAAVVVQRDIGLPDQILVENSRLVYACLGANLHGNPSRKLKLIGITGTNGKTTISYLLKHVLEAGGKHVGLIGTIKNEIDDMSVPAKHTTPDPAQLHALFERMAQAGCEYVVMEVSSHALDQYRLAGCQFEAGIFTNLTQDHLDYHGTMENYFQAKKKLFDMSRRAVINYDDAYGRRLLKEIPGEAVTFSTESDAADFTAKEISFTASASRFQLVGRSQIARVQFPMPGMFCVSNAMATAACALSLGFTLDEVVAALNSCPGVKGRTEIVPTNTDYTVICDYAHSPDGLEKILMAVREFAPGRVVILFGCAGNRDRTKRPIMAEIVARLSDFAIITSDNPRDEDPMQIIEDALPGFASHDTPYEVIVDRYSAIEWALRHALKDDILILAGKGHEEYQVLDFGTICFDERKIVHELIAKIKAEQEQK